MNIRYYFGVLLLCTSMPINYLCASSADLFVDRTHFDIPRTKLTRRLPMYHIKGFNRLPYKWTCGFHLLKHACIVEKRLFNRTTNDTLFKSVARSVVPNPRKASTNKQIEQISSLLKLSPLVNLRIEDGHVTPIFAETKVRAYNDWEQSRRTGKIKQSVVTIKLEGDNGIIGRPVGLKKGFVAKKASQKEINKLVKEAFIRRNEELFDALENHLSKRGPRCIHLACHVRAKNTPHVILITVVKNKRNRRSMYLFDNMNFSARKGSATFTYLNYFAKKFL